MSKLSDISHSRNMLMGRIKSINNNIITILANTKNPLVKQEKDLIEKVKNSLSIILRQKEDNWKKYKNLL